MKTSKQLLLTLFLAFFVFGCNDSCVVGPRITHTSTTNTVSSTNPADGDTDVSINRRVIATFSGEMDPDSITETTFTLMQGTTSVVGTVAYTGVTAIFTPASNFAFNTEYTATITTGVTDSSGHALASDYVWSFTSGATADTTAPTVSSTLPVNAATDVSLNQSLGVTFSEAMDPLTITDTTFTVTQGGTAVAGTVSYAGLVAVFVPEGGLAADTLYTATITTSATDLAGNALAANYVWTFTSGTTVDETPPTVSSTVPVNTATGVARNSSITAAFDEGMNTLTITGTTFTLTGPGTTPVAGAVSYVLTGSVATFNPTSDLAADTLYTATITTSVTDLAGNALAANKVWTFTTGAAADTTRPTVILPTSPADLDIDVFLNRQITATFSEDMDATTMTTTNWTLTEPGTAPVPLVGNFDYDLETRIATFNPGPNVDLLPDTTYTATLTTGMKDLAGNALANDEVWTFTTGTTINPLVVAGFAIGDILQPYGVLSGAAITLGGGPLSVTGFRVDGDVGVSPSGTCNGCDSTTVNGTINAANAAADAAKVALIDAYDDAIGRATNRCTLVAGGDLSINPPPVCNGASNGTFPAGLYWSGTSITIGVGATITLDAQNDSNAVFIFQAETTIGSLANTHVVLANGALAKNVFWVSKTSATIGGVGSDFAGTIIALSAITVNTDTQMEGRALAMNAGLTVQDNALITVPAP